jgi:hypothetical protein
MTLLMIAGACAAVWAALEVTIRVRRARFHRHTHQAMNLARADELERRRHLALVKALGGEA